MTERQEQALSDAKSALELSNRIPYQALELANSALNFAHDDDTETQAFAFAALGSSYASLGRFEEAARHIGEAQKLAFELRLTYVIARIHQARGWIAYAQGNSVLAFSDWQIAFDYFQQIRDMRGTAWILMHYGANYCSLGLLDHSIRCQVSALELVTLLDDTATQIDLRISLARTYVEKAWQRSFVGDKGFSYYDAQIATAIVLKVLDQYANDLTPLAMEQAYHSLGEAFLIQDRPEEALQNLQIALEASTHGGHYSSEARIQGAIGYAHFLCGNSNEARRFLASAIDEAPDATPVDDMALIQLFNSSVLEGERNYRAAMLAMRKSAELEQKAQQSRMTRWAKVHDMTLGIGQALVPVETIAQQENGWIFTERQIERHHSRVETMLRYDPLTAVLNQNEALAQASSNHFEVAAIFEVTNMGLINEKFGRTAGDEVLRNIATILVASLPRDAVIGRYSGNEFFVATHANDFEKIDAAIKRFPWLAIDQELSVHVNRRLVQPEKPNILAA
ncbi:MAG: diguanylate cyclase [Armatimonadetes bacterium]|nr:diguanylate cyclase [Armatimonadota bacterium]MBS1725495.1 diguanylate cyclase [Armatimonadota bacterium]